MNRRLFAVILLVSLLMVLLAISGCGSKSETTTPEQQTEETEVTETEKETEAEVLDVGETASVEDGKVSVSKVTVTNDLASPEANALLLTGEAGESTNSSQAPSAGNEFLMITFLYKNTGSDISTGVKPVDLTLEDGQGKQYSLVVTNGYGGLYNAQPIDAGKEASVTAVYEVPTGEKGLVLTFQPFGGEAVMFKIR
ncbi:MAG: DUF4352 domain-containing protein [Actinobacteria bacterium]|jgi:hypothetical protein|nr:MAG: DUF4352 domain-containing protein [Actinomycetota bacterium]